MAERREPRGVRRFVIPLAAVLAVCLLGGIVTAVRLEPAAAQLIVVARVGLDGMARDAPGPAADPAGNGRAVCAPVSVAFVGPLTGDDGRLGGEIRDGVRLAVDGHNAANAGCQVQLKEFDTEGSERRAGELSAQVLADVYTLGVVGPVLSRVAALTGEVFERAGLATATASARRDALSQQSRRTFFRGLAGDAAEATAVARYLTGALGHRSVCVVDDGSAAGVDVSATVIRELGPAGCGSPISLRGHDVDTVAQTIAARAPEAVVFGGPIADAAALRRGLDEEGSPVFVTVGLGSGEGQPTNAHGMLTSLPYGPQPQRFAQDYRSRFGQAPGEHSPAGYDLATVMLAGIDSGVLTREEMINWMHRYDGVGVANRYRWTPSGELADSSVWIYRVE